MADLRPPPRMGPGRRAVYRPDNSKGDGFGGFMLSDQMRDVTAEVSGDIAVTAKGFTPVGDGSNGGHMRDRYEVERNGGVLKVSSNLRVMVRIVNPSPHAAAVEFGNGRSKRHRPLGTAGAAYGDLKVSKKDLA